MSRITILLLLSLITHNAVAEGLISVDLDAIKQIAINAALLEHPELLPGDIVDGNSG
jgi:hypothetical protein